MKKRNIKTALSLVLAIALSFSCASICFAAISPNVVKQPNRTTYYQGVDWSYNKDGKILEIGSFDLSGTTLSYHGETVEYAVGKWPNMYAKPDSGEWKLGSNTMRIYCDNFGTSVYATTTAKLVGVKSISVATYPKKVFLVEGTDWEKSIIGDVEFTTLDLTGLTLKVEYTDGTYKTVSADENNLIGWAAPDTDNPSPGETITMYATFAGKTAPFCVTFLEKGQKPVGDVNGDMKINSVDALLILQFSVGKLAFSDDEFARADVDNNGSINSTDALSVLQYSVGKITRFN